jgi:hypothetical protein
MDAFNAEITSLVLAAIGGAVVTLPLGALLRRRALVAAAFGSAGLLVALWLGYAAIAYVTAAGASAERHGLDERRALLSRQTAEPGSLSACIDGLVGELVEDACRAAVFATPQAVAVAVAQAAARLTLLADSLAYAQRRDPPYAAMVISLRRAAENDAYGLYAHVLAVRDGCTPDHCPTFELLTDTRALKAHMREQTYDHSVAENSLRWRQPPAETVEPPRPSAQETPAEPKPLAAMPPSPPPSASAAAPADSVASSALGSGPIAGPTSWPPVATGGLIPPRVVVPPVASVLPNLEYPSSDSIPPVSIMSPEPRATAAAGEASAQTSPAPASPPVPMPRAAPRQQ